MRLFIPLDLIESNDMFKALAFRYMAIDRPREFNGVDIIIPFGDLYQDMLPLLLSYNIRMEELNSWIELPISKLDEFVPEAFEYAYKNIDEDGKKSDLKTLREYVLSYRENESTCLIKVSHKDANGSRQFETTYEETMEFINEYGKDDLSNIFVKDELIQSKIAGYNADDDVTKISKG